MIMLSPIIRVVLNLCGQGNLNNNSLKSLEKLGNFYYRRVGTQ